jgi:hypothetical protein
VYPADESKVREIIYRRVSETENINSLGPAAVLRQAGERGKETWVNDQHSL